MTDTMTVPQISERLTALHTALVEKVGGHPYFEPTLNVRQSGKAVISLYGTGRKYDHLATASEHTIAGCLDAAEVRA